jgi:hypothetical protein
MDTARLFRHDENNIPLIEACLGIFQPRTLNPEPLSLNKSCIEQAGERLQVAANVHYSYSTLPTEDKKCLKKKEKN